MPERKTVGQLMEEIVNHVLDRDTPMIHAEVFFLALAIALCNIAADLVQWAIGRKKGVA